MKDLVKVKKSEQDALELRGYFEFFDESSGEYFYLKNGKKVDDCRRFTSDGCITKKINKSGSSFCLDIGHNFFVLKSFQELIKQLS